MVVSNVGRTCVVVFIFYVIVWVAQAPYNIVAADAIAIMDLGLIVAGVYLVRYINLRLPFP